jgi:inhibitor of KinA
LPDPLTYKRYGDRAILIEWPPLIDHIILNEIVEFKNIILENKREQIQDIIIGYNSLTIIYWQYDFDFQKEMELLKSIEKSEKSSLTPKTNTWEIPLCYDEEFGIDLTFLSKTLKLSKTEIIDLHSTPMYTVYFIGFLPGFMYLGGLDEKLHVPRKDNPRLNVDKGAVGIGGSQTGIYPSESAGGWQIIGKTPLSLFDVNQDRPCFASSGDQIQFKPISLEEFKTIENNAALKLKYFTND